jgi:hypothetical protein
MAKTTWQDKVPADMTAEELQEAKAYVADRLAPVQEDLNALSAAAQHLDAEINMRFRMGNYSQVNPAMLPPYPVDFLAAGQAAG